jgi:deoxyribodipyrimidine photolyase-related protein
MVPNIFGMGTFADNGFMMRKPYISSSAYIFRSSNYSKRDTENAIEKKRGERWFVTWDKLYKSFLARNRNKLKNVVY